MHNFAEAIEQINWLTVLKLFVQTVIICYCTIWIWRRIRGTQAERLVKGVMILIGVCVVSYYAGFTLITSILQHVIPVAVLALLIVFQPEVRRGLGYIGRMKPFFIDFSLPNNEAVKTEYQIDQIIKAVSELSRNRIGALLVVEPPEGERDYLSPGTPIHAEISKPLILSIFYPNSPLHDGALVIREDKIIAAGVILPMTDDPKLSYRYGTRHRAAIGLSEIYDGLCIVVSEETGAVSAANRGMLVRYNDAQELADPLKYLYNQNTHPQAQAGGPLNSFLTLFSKGRRDSGAHAAVQPSINEQTVYTRDDLRDRSDTIGLPLVPPKPVQQTQEEKKAGNGHQDPRMTGEISIADLSPPEPEQVL